ncbi:MAG: hypothetical protein L0Z62_30345 [Gemmataceae bacterium]|nr:hypothetical protein [Gemmataceae bacterium]
MSKALPPAVVSRLLLGAVLLGALAAPGSARGGEPLPDEAVKKSLQAFFTRFTAVMKDGDAKRIAALFDPDRLLEEWRRIGALPKGMTPRQEADARAGFLAGFSKSAAQLSRVFGWSRTEIQSIKLLAKGQEAVVVARHRGDGGTAKMRWWLKKDGPSWRLYDLEDLDTGIRISTLLAGAFAELGQGLVVPDWIKAGPLMQRAGKAMVEGNIEEAERLLVQIARYEFPKPLAALRWMMEGAIRLAQQRPAEALACCEKARTFNPDVPILDFLSGAACNALRRFDKALTHLHAYRNLLGEDTNISHQLGIALAGLGRREEAAQAFRRSLDDDPKSLDALNELRRLLPRGKKGELAKRFARVPNARLFFDELAQEALRDRDAEGIEVLASALPRKGADPVVDMTLARAKALQGKADEAVRLFKKAVPGIPDGPERQSHVTEFLLDMLEGDRPLEAYRAAPDPDSAFLLLAQSLHARRDSDLLRGLVEAHRKARGPGPWTHFYSGVLAVDERAYDRADREFAAAAKAGPLNAKERERIREQRVLARYLAGKGLSAYQDVGPAPMTFTQLARLFSQSAQVEQLEALLGAHRQADPKDPGLPIWEAEVKWLKKDDAGLVRLLKEQRDAFADRQHRMKFIQRLLSALVRLKRIDEARKEAEALARGSAEDRRELGFLLADARRWLDSSPVAREMARVVLPALAAAADGVGERLFYQARLKAVEGNVGEGSLLLRLALGRTEDAKARERYTTEFLFDALDAGKPLEGYRAAPDHSRAFRLLGEELLNDVLDAGLPDGPPWRAGGVNPPVSFGKKPDGKAARENLGRLIEAHRDNAPEEPLLILFAGELHLAAGRHDQADREFAAGMARPLEEGLRERFRSVRVFARYRAGKGLSAYTDVGPRRATFRQLANLFANDKKARELQALVSAHRKIEPDDSDLPVWEVEARWLAGSYADVVQLLGDHREVFDGPTWQWKYRDRLVRSLARLKRFDEALQEAEAIAKERHGSPLLVAVVHAAAGDVERTGAALAKYLKRNHDTYALYADPDLGPALCSEPFRALRQRHPESLMFPLGATLPGLRR